MRSVRRVAKPKSLQRNAARWTRELLAAIAEAERGESAVPTKLKHKYRRDDVREALRVMYGGLCCYCESRISDVAYGNIEHRNPRSNAPELFVEWTNLHLACPKCNGAKSDRWDSAAEILDASEDCITDHLTYKESGLSVFRWQQSRQGETTIHHADLNRQSLLDTRTRIFMEAIKTIREIRAAQRSDSESPQLRPVIDELKRKSLGEHGSLIAFLLSEHLGVS